MCHDENPPYANLNSSPDRKDFIKEGYRLRNKITKELEKKINIKYKQIPSIRQLILRAQNNGQPMWSKEYPLLIFYKKLPMSTELKEDIAIWEQDYLKSVHNRPSKTLEETQDHIQEGFFLEQKLRQQLYGSFTIVYKP